MNIAQAHREFERRKNLKALGITISVCTLLLLLLFMVSWTVPRIPPPAQDDGVEVNLGNSDQGLGTIASQMPGDMPKADETDYKLTKTATSTAEPEETKEVADNNEADAPVVKTSPKPVNKPKPAAILPKAVKPNDKPAAAVTQASPKPKAVYKGGKSASVSGGNNGDSYNGVRSQGVAGGSGDQGKPNGNPNSDSYTGNGGTGKSGVSIRSGLNGRRFTRLPSFTDEFNENAKVAVDITVDKSGSVVNAVVNPRGTTTINQGIKSIALNKARQLKLNTGSAEEQTGTIVFDFKLRG